MVTVSYVLCVLITLAVIYFIRKLVKRKRILKLIATIPSTSTLPILGHALQIESPTEVLNCINDLMKIWGPMLRVSVFWKETIFLTDAKRIEQLLKSSEMLYKSGEYLNFHKWLGQGLLTAEPAQWHQTRKILTPAFHFQVLQKFIDVFNCAADVFVSKLQEQCGSYSVNIYDYANLYTLDVICETAMGTKVNAQIHSDSKYVLATKEINRILAAKIFSPIKRFPLLFYFTNDYQMEIDTLKYLHDYTYSVIRKRRQDIADNNDCAEKKEKKRLAFLDLLIQTTIDGRPMTDDEIRQEVDTFMLGGHDSTSSAITSTLYCLAFHSDIQEKVYEEVVSIFGNDKIRYTTLEDLQNMNYLEMVIKETLRIYPSIPIIGRHAHKDMLLGDQIIPKGVDIAVFVWGLHRNSEIFPEPEKFIPERFTLENQSQRSPFGYLPFSAGPRNCIGQKFAMLELKLTISKLVRNFKFSPVRDFQPLWVPNMVLTPSNGIHITLEARRN